MNPHVMFFFFLNVGSWRREVLSISYFDKLKIQKCDCFNKIWGKKIPSVQHSKRIMV